LADRTVPAVLPPGPGERGEHLVGLARPVDHRAGIHGVGRADQLQLHVRLAQGLGHSIITPAAVRPEVAGSEDGGCLGVPDQGGDLFPRIAVAHGDRMADVLVEGSEGLEQPHPSVVARRTPEAVVEDEHRQHPPGLGRGAQRRVVSQAQITPHPPDHRRLRHRTHGRGTR
jgi:hypothetical protein